MSDPYDYIDDFDTEIQSDELREAQYWDEYREWMEGEELDIEPEEPEDDMWYDDERPDEDPDYDHSYGDADDGQWDDVPW